MKKIVPPQWKLDKIQEMIYDNRTFKDMGAELDYSPQTVQRIAFDANLDMSEYDPIIAKARKRQRNLSETQQKALQDAFDAGYSKTEIEKQFRANSQMLTSWIKRYNIDLSNYHKPLSHLKQLSGTQIDELQKWAQQGIKYKEMAHKLGVSRNLIPKLLTRYGIKTKKDEHFNKPFNLAEVRALESIAKYNISENKIALCFGRGIDFIKSELKKHNIKLCRDNHKAIKTEDLLQCLKIAIESSEVSSSRNTLEISEIEKLPQLLKERPFEEVCERLSKSPKAIKGVLKLLNYNKILWLDALLSSDFKEEFKQDMSDTSLTNTLLERKYGLSLESIRKYRKSVYGIQDVRGANVSGMSTAEYEFKQILDALDLAYIFQKFIGKYRVDFYLGQKLVVEIQGDYWHQKGE